MLIIIKCIFRNICINKLRTSIIILSIAMSTAMFLSSQSISDSIIKIQVEALKTNVGTSDIIIRYDDGKSFFDINNFNEGLEKFSYKIGVVEGNCMYENNEEKEKVNFTLKGIDYNDLFNISTITFKEKEFTNFKGNQIILGLNTANKYKLEIGKNIHIKINGKEESFKVVGISNLVGFFANDGMNNIGIVPRETLANLYDNNNLVNVMYLKMASDNISERENVIRNLEKVNNNYKIEESYSQSDVEAQSNTMSTQFLVMLIVISVMSLFIIYSSFKVLTLERIPIIGTFRSIGATERTTRIVLALESFIYGVIGGIIGCLLGIGILYIMAKLCTPIEMKGARVFLEYSTVKVLLAFLWAVILSLFSAIIPIVRVSKMSIKNIVLNLVEDKIITKKGKPIVGIIMLLIAFILPPLSPIKIGVFCNVVALISLIISLFLLTPVLVNYILIFLEKIYSLFLGNIGVLACKNIKKNIMIINNILLLEIAIGTILSVYTVTGSVIDEMRNLTVNSYTCDLRVKIPNSNKEIEEEIKNVDGVKDTYGIYYKSSIEIEGNSKGIGLIEGVNKEKYLEFREFNYNGNKKEILDELDSDRNILLTYTIRDRYDYKVGDKIILIMNNKKVTYNVIGFFYSLLEHGGNFALISEKNFMKDMNAGFYSEIYVKTSKNEKVVQDKLNDEFYEYNIWTRTLKEQEELNNIGSSQKVNIFKGLSIVVLIIGIFGILNNMIINLVQRKRSLAIYRSIGISRKGSVKMILIESFSSGILGAILGVVFGLSIVYISKFLMKAISRPFPLHCSFSLFTLFFLGSIAINLVSSIMLSKKVSRINIIESIKYE